MKENKKAIKVIGVVVSWFLIIIVLYLLSTAICGDFRLWKWDIEVRLWYLFFSLSAIPFCILIFFNDNFA